MKGPYFSATAAVPQVRPGLPGTQKQVTAKRSGTKVLIVASEEIPLEATMAIRDSVEDLNSSASIFHIDSLANKAELEETAVGKTDALVIAIGVSGRFEQVAFAAIQGAGVRRVCLACMDEHALERYTARIKDGKISILIVGKDEMLPMVRNRWPNILVFAATDLKASAGAIAAAVADGRVQVT